MGITDMVDLEFYRKRRTKYPPVDKLSRVEWWQILLIIMGAVLIEPLVVYKKVRHIPFTRSYYVEQIKYFVLLSIPFFLFYLWMNWRETVKRTRGYCWVGRFEVIQKKSSMLSCHLMLAPGKENKLKVNRSFFNKVHEGDIVMIRRDVLGKIERVILVKDFAARFRRLTIRGGNPTRGS
jgi:hypothetical protein